MNVLLHKKLVTDFDTPLCFRSSIKKCVLKFGWNLNDFPENPGAKKCYEKVGFKERTLTENAFSFKDEFWGRCNMITTR